MKFRASVLSNPEGTTLDLSMGKVRRTAKKAIKDLRPIMKKIKSIYWFGIIPYPAPKWITNELAKATKQPKRKR